MRKINYLVIIAVGLLNFYMGTRWLTGDHVFQLPDLANLFAALVMAYLLISTMRKNRQEDMRLIIATLVRTPDQTAADISLLTGLSVSTVIVTLFRLEEQGKIHSRWEVGPQPRRRLYSVVQ